MADKGNDAGPFWLIAVYGMLLALAIGFTGLAYLEESRLYAPAGAMAIFFVLSTFPVAVYLRRLVYRSEGIETEVLVRLTETIRTMSEQQALSDDARRVLNRRSERDLLCKAIEEDISAEDWDAASTLVKELAERFGYRAEAEDFRQRIDKARSEFRENRVADLVREVDALIVRAEWDKAALAADRVVRLYPDSPKVDGLRHRVSDARERYKSEIERRFLHAAQADRVDEAMELLKELDQYLTEAEAEPYIEVARGVVGKARENLGVQFKLAVHDKQWRQAAEIGEQIIREFPNSRMAAEVRQIIDSVRDRAAAIATARS